MSMPEPMNPYDSPEPAKQGMSGGAKVLLGVGIGCGVLVLLCCGGLFLVGIFTARGLQQAVSTEPEKVREITQTIVTIEPPAPLEPRMSFNLGIPFSEKKMMTMAIWSDQAIEEKKEPASLLILFQIDGNFANREELKARLESELQQQSSAKWEEVQLESTETIEVEVNGSPAQFTFGKGKRDNDDKEVWQVVGAFDGKAGPAMLFMQLETEKFNEEQARSVLSSMSSMSTERNKTPEKSAAPESPSESAESPATETPAK